MPPPAHKPDRPRGIATHQRERHHVRRHNRARGNHRVLADDDAAPHRHAGADAGVMLDKRRFDLPLFTDARIAVVGEGHMRADEHVTFDDDTFENRNVVLHSNTIAKDAVD